MLTGLRPDELSGGQAHRGLRRRAGAIRRSACAPLRHARVVSVDIRHPR
jgi:hypothetical protein